MVKKPNNELEYDYSKALSEPELNISLPNFNDLEKHDQSYFIGRKDELDKLVDILERTNGGSYLVSGYRGVGKTRFVDESLKAMPLYPVANPIALL